MHLYKQKGVLKHCPERLMAYTNYLDSDLTRRLNEYYLSEGTRGADDTIGTQVGSSALNRIGMLATTKRAVYDPFVVAITKIICAYVATNEVSYKELPDLIDDISRALCKSSIRVTESRKPQPSVSVSKSVQRDYIVCLEDGQKFKSLKRHLRVRYGLTPDAYRDKWELPPSYPMVAPSYREKRSDLARRAGLGNRKK
jgi:predicted transcriptional regulator